MHFKDMAILRRQDVLDDIAAALNVCRSIKLGVVQGHERCPFDLASDMAEEGLVRLMARFTDRGGEP